MAALGAVAGILIQAWATPLASARAAAPEKPPGIIVELAGADETDKSKPAQLKKADQNMVPAEGMKKAEPKSEPSMPMKSADDADKMPAKAAPAAETRPEPKPMAKPAEAKMAKPAEAGFYLRADVGYGFTSDPDGTTSGGTMTSESVDNAPLIGAGVGYRFDKHLRADVTFDFRSDADVSATTARGTAVTSEVNGWTVMANAYWDIDNFGGFTPYVGAGLGYARLETATQVGDTGDGGASSDNLAWAGMLGLAVDTGMAGTVVDLGYRFISLGEFQQASGGASYDDLIAHEIRAGLRFSF
ncbi:MAG: outer membrane protein [Rhodospirillaceae bacterium]